MQATLGVGKEMFAAFIEDTVVAYRLQQVADTLLLSIMEKNVLAKNVLKIVFSRLCKRRFYPTIFGRMQMPADGEEITSREQLLEFGVANCTVAIANCSAHRRYRKQPLDVTV